MKKLLMILCIEAGLLLHTGKGCRNVINEYYANLPYIIFKDSE